MSQSVCTVATRSCKQGWINMVASYSLSGSKVPLVTYTSNDNEALSEGIKLNKYWKKYSRIGRSCNSYAALKIDAIMSEFDNGIDEVIYLDGADVLLFSPIEELFSLFSAEIEVGAHHWLDDFSLTYKDDEVKSSFHDQINAKYPYVNNGVIYMKNTPAMRMFLVGWKAMVLNAGLRVAHSPKQLGDQLDFNIFLREFFRVKPQAYFNIPPQWNTRGHHAKQIRIEGGTACDEAGMRVHLGHASGVGSYFHDDVVAFALRERSNAQ
jgi:hypothetical protein